MSIKHTFIFLKARYINHLRKDDLCVNTVDKKIIKDSDFIALWKNEMIETMRTINPQWNKKDIDKILNKMLAEQMQNPDVNMDNNVTGENRDSTLLSVLDWLINRKPIISGNGTFYKNQHEALNPIAKMLDKFLNNRKAVKKKMFQVEDKTSDRYKDLDREQLNWKILVNSYYGASGMPKSAFYSTYSGPATTGVAQSVISTTETLFESFLVDNFKFIDINEAFHYMNTILQTDYELDDWIIPVTRGQLFDRIVSMFYDDIYRDEYEEPLRLFIEHLTQEEVTKIYYKNQFMEFTRVHENIRKDYDELFSSIRNLKYAKTIEDIPEELLNKFGGSDEEVVKSYNSYVNNQYFMDPNSPPDTVTDILKKLGDIYMKYVYHPFMVIDRIYRLKFFNRKTVCIVDTDSNILAMDSWVDFCNDHLLRSDYGRSDENNTFIMINTIAYFITNAVGATLEVYGEYSNIPEDFRARFNMKNEFYFNKLIIGRKKKRYISSIKLREGNLLDPYKADVKGFDFMKATTSEYAKKRFDTIVKNHILESPLPDISAILGELSKFERDIRESINNGELTYLPLGNAKDLSAYKDPYSQQGVRGSLAWNIIYPDRAISFPSKVSILKLKIFTLDDMDDLASTNPDIYKTIKTQIFGSSNEKFAKKGLQVIAIPQNEKIPEWCFPYIDYNTVINNIIGQFQGVLDTFGINSPEVGKTIKSVNRKTKKFSNIVRF